MDNSSDYLILDSICNGKGTLINEEEKKCDCKFKTFQQKNGSIYLRCNCHMSDLLKMYSIDLPETGNTYIQNQLILLSCLDLYYNDQILKINRFEGFSFENDRLKGTIIILKEFSTNSSNVEMTFILKDLDIDMVKQDHSRKISFSITNFEFEGNSDSEKSLEFNLNNGKKCIIQKHEEYESTIKKLKHNKYVSPTCNLLIDIDAETTIEKLIEICDDLCLIMSIARGTQVQWINYDILNYENEILFKKLVSRVTKPFVGLSLISINPKETKEFIEKSFLSFVSKPDLLKNNKALLYAYIGAKSDIDYIEQRSIKIAVIMEMLKELYLKLPNEYNRKYNKLIITKNQFDSYRKKIEEILFEITENKFNEKPNFNVQKISDRM